MVIPLGARQKSKSMAWATYMSNMVLLEESDAKIPNSLDYYNFSHLHAKLALSTA